MSKKEQFGDSSRMEHEKAPSLADLRGLDAARFEGELRKFFVGEEWVAAYFKNLHHGFDHGDKVRQQCLSFVDKLLPEETKALQEEGASIDEEKPLEASLAVIELAGLFHDCGRLNDEGNFKAEDQKDHHTVGAARARKLFEKFGFDSAIRFSDDAILSHDFQSEELTPFFSPPETMIGKIVQASDQVGWYHPDSVHRTLKYNNELGAPFFNGNVGIGARLSWRPNDPPLDALTVMLHQLTGPTGSDRFGIAAAGKIVNENKKALEASILKMAEEFKVEREVRDLIEQFQEARN